MPFCFVLYLLFECTLVCTSSVSHIAPEEKTRGTCLLQVSSQRPRSQHRSLGQSSRNSTSVRHYVFFGQHKSGSLMAWEAAVKMQQAVAHSSSLRFEFNRHLGNALFSSEMLHYLPQQACLLHFARNPFEMIVSGYLYHMADSEAWLSEPFGKVRKLMAEQFPEGCVAGQDWRCRVYRGIDEVYQSSLSSSASFRLPLAKSTETFPEYLRRSDLTTGLTAEFIWAANYSLASMRFANEFVQKPAAASSCNLNVCFHEFYENCPAAWQRVLQAWQVQEPDYTSALRAVTRSCPSVSRAAERHSSDRLMRKKHLSHPREPEMLQRLQELDRSLFKGALADLEEYVQCNVSGKYRMPSAA